MVAIVLECTELNRDEKRTKVSLSQELKVRNLSTSIAHSITVNPSFRASSFSSLSLISGLNSANAFKCSTVVIPSFSSTGERCVSGGLHELRIPPNVCEVADEVERIVLMIEPSFVGANDGMGPCWPRGVDCCMVISIVLIERRGGLGGGVGGNWLEGMLELDEEIGEEPWGGGDFTACLCCCGLIGYAS